METDAPAILIVDDNEDNRYTLQLLLESDSHSRLATASGGHEALALRRSLQGLKAVTDIQGNYSP
jgi:CheY-like chemotaxis protein